LKKSFLALGILGILFILFGTGFALQGDGILMGSPMSGNSFWIYAGAGVVVVGVIMAALGFILGSRRRTPVSTKMVEPNTSGTTSGSSSSDPAQSKPIE
jgi:hypothetical protein